MFQLDFSFLLKSYDSAASFSDHFNVKTTLSQWPII